MLLGALMAAGSVAALVLTRSQVQQMALDTSVKSLKGVVREAFLMIDQVEKSVEKTVTAVEQQLDDPDAMYGYSRQLLEHHPYLSGCSISFEPDYFKSKGKYFSAHAYRDGDSIVTEQEGNDQYQYYRNITHLVEHSVCCKLHGSKDQHSCAKRHVYNKFESAHLICLTFDLRLAYELVP